MKLFFPLPRLARCTLAAALCAAALPVLQGCAPLLVGGAFVGTTMVALDRRTSGTQVEDEGIELKALGRLRDLGTLGHVNVTSYNRVVLLTGEVPSEADKNAVAQMVARIENVKSLVNELAVMENSAAGDRTRDTFISGRVKAAFVDAPDLLANATKVVTERGIVYLMGIVTEREAARFADVARTVNGVQKVVRVFETISEAELASRTPPPPPK